MLMEVDIEKTLLIIPFLFLIAAAGLLRVEANDYAEPVLIRCTCYTATGNPTASGVMPYEGIVAGKREWLGCVAVLYTSDMEFIGFFEFRDTGGSYISSGERIDVYRDTLERCYDWIGQYGDYVYMQIIPAEG